MLEYSLTADEAKLIEEHRKQNPLPVYLSEDNYQPAGWYSSGHETVIHLSEIIDKANSLGANLRDCELTLTAYSQPYEGTHYDDFNLCVTYYGKGK